MERGEARTSDLQQLALEGEVEMVIAILGLNALNMTKGYSGKHGQVHQLLVKGKFEKVATRCTKISIMVVGDKYKEFKGLLLNARAVAIFLANGTALRDSDSARDLITRAAQYCPKSEMIQDNQKVIYNK